MGTSPGAKEGADLCSGCCHCGGESGKEEGLMQHCGAPSSRASAACQAGAQPGLSPQPEPAFVKRPRRMGRGLAPCEAPGGGGGCTPNLACSARIWPIRSARLLPTWRPTGSPPR